MDIYILIFLAIIGVVGIVVSLAAQLKLAKKYRSAIFVVDPWYYEMIPFCRMASVTEHFVVLLKKDAKHFVIVHRSGQLVYFIEHFMDYRIDCHSYLLAYSDFLEMTDVFNTTDLQVTRWFQLVEQRIDESALDSCVLSKPVSIFTLLWILKVPNFVAIRLLLNVV